MRMSLSGWGAAFIFFLTGCASVGPKDDAASNGVQDGHSADAAVVELAAKTFKVTTLPDWVLPEDKPVKGQAAPIYFERLDLQYRFSADGLVERFIHIVIGGTDGNKMQNEGQQAIAFDPRYERVELHRAQLLRGNTRIDVLARVRPRFLVNDTVRNTIYQGRVNAVFQVPDYRAGDRLEFAWSLASKNPLLAGQVGTLDNWSVTVAPVWNRRTVYLFPDSLPLHVSLLANDDARRTRQDKIKRQETTVGNMRRIVFTDKNLPLLPTEDNVARGAVQNDFIQSTSFSDWTAVAAWGEALFAAAPAPQSEEYRQRLVALRAIDGDAARASAALQWVQREIRYVSMSFGENSHRPHSPDDTLARRYGDCKDVSLLLVRLLRDLGLDAQPALIMTQNGRLPKRLGAAPMVFNHAVVALWLDGRMHVLDGTQRGQISALEHLGNIHGGADLLILGGPHAGLVPAPYTGSEDDRTLRVTEKMTLKDDGLWGVLTRNVVYRGVLAEEQRLRVQAVDAVTLRRNQLADIARFYPDAEVLSGPTVNDDKGRNEVQLSVRFAIPEPFKRSGPNWRHEYRTGDIIARLPRVISSKREIPLSLPFNVQRVHFEHTLEVPQPFRIDEDAFEERVDIELLRASIRRERPTPTRLVDRLELELRSDEIPRAAIADYRRAVQPWFDFRSEVRLKRMRPR